MHLGYHGNGRHFGFCQPLTCCHILHWIFLQSFMKFDERNPIFFKSPLFCFHDNCGKICPTDSDFGLSRSTRCGYCSYQVSSISVRRVTCYDNFCVFHFFSILVVSMAMLEKSTLKDTTSHGIWYSYKISQSLIKASPRNVSDKILTEERKKERKKERRRIIMRIIRNRANTICLPNFVWRA